MDDLCDATGSYSLPVDSRSALLKSFVREAQAHAKNCMFEGSPNEHTSKLLRFSRIARAVWHGDLTL